MLLQPSLAISAVIVLSACGTAGGLGTSAASQDVRQRAENAGFAMAKTSRHASAIEHARRVVGGSPGDIEIALMQAEGTGVDGHVVLRISSVYDDDGPYDNDSSASGCFRYEFGDSSGGTHPQPVSCPRSAAMTLPPPPFEPVLPPDAAERLDRVLRNVPSPAEVRAAFPERGLKVAVAEAEDAVGVAVGATPGECVMGRRLPSGVVEVWHVPRVLAMPGELGCDAGAAAAGRGQNSPQ